MALYCIKVFPKQGDGPKSVLTDSSPTHSPQVPSYRNRQSTRKKTPKHPLFPTTSNLAGLGGNLGGRALGTLLALDALGGTLGGALGLLGLLLALGGALLLLGLLDGLLAGGLTGLGALGAALLDHVEGGTDDGTLVLHNTAGTLLGNFLFVHIPVSNPSQTFHPGVS